MDNFLSLGLPQPLLNSLERLQFTTPTPVQAQAIPAALQGRDILGSAATGTGKTGAFGIPLIAKLMNSPRGAALVMTPTRELAVQVMKMLESLLGPKSNIKTALLIGGEPYPKQLTALRAQPRLIVGTPGRINDHIEKRTLILHLADFLVLDETDRMLDMGFTEQIENVIKFLPKKRQTLLFSATLPKNIVRIAQSYMVDPVRVEIGDQSTAAPNISQKTLKIAEKDKYAQLVKECGERNGSIIVFVKTKWNADKMATRLRADHIDAEAIHGDLRQNKRDKVIKNFRAKKYRVLVATDIAARGLDIPHIEHVINYDLPQVPEDYIHRIGRTARAGAVGEALCFISPADEEKWGAIMRLIDPDNAPVYNPKGKSRSGSGKSRAGSGRSQGKSYGKSGDADAGRGSAKARPARKASGDSTERNAGKKTAAPRDKATDANADAKPSGRRKPFNKTLSNKAPRSAEHNADKPAFRGSDKVVGKPASKSGNKSVIKNIAKPTGKIAGRKADAPPKRRVSSDSRG